MNDKKALLEYRAKAMQALIGCNYIINEDGVPDVRFDYSELAKEAFLYAKELLELSNEK